LEAGTGRWSRFPPTRCTDRDRAAAPNSPYAAAKAGGNVRGWIHVDDHCRGIQLVLQHGRAGQTYHINGDTEDTPRTAYGRTKLAAERAVGSMPGPFAWRLFG
jgi:nucleoside-diphosphate-sugar epimerase